MLSLVFMVLSVYPETHHLCHKTVRLAVVSKGWCMGSQIKEGMASEQVIALLGVPKEGGPIPSLWGTQVGNKGYWVYPEYGIRVNWYTPNEIWWAVPSPNPPYTPRSARVASTEFFVPR